MLQIFAQYLNKETLYEHHRIENSLCNHINALVMLFWITGGGEMIADVFLDHSTYAEPPSRLVVFSTSWYNLFFSKLLILRWCTYITCYLWRLEACINIFSSVVCICWQIASLKNELNVMFCSRPCLWISQVIFIHFMLPDLRLEPQQLVKLLVWELQLIIFRVLACKRFMNMRCVP